jgi:hypothetical protein
MLRRERRWHGQTPSSFRAVPNKPTLQFNQQPTWAELILLRLIERDGWAGAWVKNWGGRREFCRDIGEAAQLPSHAWDLLQKIGDATGLRSGGCWDIFAARNQNFLFLESKQRSQDSISETQKKWMKSALELGVPASSFAIVEWVAPKS